MSSFSIKSERPDSPGVGESSGAAASSKGKSTGAQLRGQELKAVIKSVDMPEDVQARAVETVVASLETYDQEKDMAMYIKKEFDRMYGTTWHCVVGKNFGSFVTHETKNFIYFYLGPIAILLWKTS